jgi:hypothetical protein
VNNRFDRVVRAVLALVALTCAVAAVLTHPEPLGAPARVAWIRAEEGERYDHHVLAKTFAIDVVSAGTVHASYSAAPIDVMRGARVRAVGWAFDPRSSSVADRFLMRIDSRGWSNAGEYHMARPDVAAAFGRPRLRDCGFAAIANTSGLRPGLHRIEFATQIGRDPPMRLAQTITIRVLDR